MAARFPAPAELVPTLHFSFPLECVSRAFAPPWDFAQFRAGFRARLLHVVHVVDASPELRAGVDVVDAHQHRALASLRFAVLATRDSTTGTLRCPVAILFGWSTLKGNPLKNVKEKRAPLGNWEPIWKSRKVGKPSDAKWQHGFGFPVGFP